MTSLDLAKVKYQITKLTQIVGIDDMTEQQLDKYVQMIQAHTVVDLIDLTQESEEKKALMRAQKLPQEEIIKNINSEISQNYREDVFMASLQRHLELIVGQVKDNLSSKQLQEAEHFIGNITKEQLRPEGYQPPAPEVEAPASQPEVDSHPPEQEEQKGKSAEDILAAISQQSEISVSKDNSTTSVLDQTPTTTETEPEPSAPTAEPEVTASPSATPIGTEAENGYSDIEEPTSDDNDKPVDKEQTPESDPQEEDNQSDDIKQLLTQQQEQINKLQQMLAEKEYPEPDQPPAQPQQPVQNSDTLDSEPIKI